MRIEKLITRVALLRRGIRLFTEEVNDHLDRGWGLVELSICKKGLRTICYAVVVKGDCCDQEDCCNHTEDNYE